MKATELRQYFPVLDTEVYGKPLVYFDNAATSQRPVQVVDCQKDMAINHNANIHRAVHKLSADATDAYEAARDAARSFLGAADRSEIIFTAGATSAINLVAYSFCEAFVGEGDEIVVGVAEHHSNFVPWQQLAARRKAVVRYLYPDADARYSVSSLEPLLSGKTRIVCLGHASNVLGLVNPIPEITALCHSKGIPVMVDGAQGAVHGKVDVQALGADFYAFSAHKLFGPTGVGVLYARRELLEQLPPFLYGGEMVGTVSVEGTGFAPLPMRFEAGTQNFNSVAALLPALEFADRVLTDRELNEEFEQTAEYMGRELRGIEGITIYGDAPSGKLPIFSFNVAGVHHEDLAILLDKMGVAVRSGQMCAEPLMTHLGVTGMVRASLLPYNTRGEVDLFISALRRAVAMLS